MILSSLVLYSSVLILFPDGLLQVEKIGIHDNFFDLGGNSLLMVKVHSKLREKFSYDVNLVEMFRHPTISALVTYFSDTSNKV